MVINKWYLIILLWSTWQMDAMVRAMQRFLHKKEEQKTNGKNRRSHSLNEKELFASIKEPQQEKMTELKLDLLPTYIQNPEGEIGNEHSHDTPITIQRCGSEQNLNGRRQEISTKITQLKQQNQKRVKRSTVHLQLYKQQRKKACTKATNDLKTLLLKKNETASQNEIEALWHDTQGELANINNVDEDGNILCIQLIKEIAKYKDTDLIAENTELKCLIASLKNFLEIARCEIDWEHKNKRGQTAIEFLETNSNCRILNFVRYYVYTKKPGEDTLNKYKQKKLGQNIFEPIE